jgi:hypothetical protein
VAGFVIAVVGGVLPFALGLSGLGRPRAVVGIGGIVAVGWVFALAAKRTGSNQVPLWFVGGLVMLLYAIWCGGLWLGVRLRRMRQATPG